MTLNRFADIFTATVGAVMVALPLILPPADDATMRLALVMAATGAVFILWGVTGPASRRRARNRRR